MMVQRLHSPRLARTILAAVFLLSLALLLSGVATAEEASPASSAEAGAEPAAESSEARYTYSPAPDASPVMPDTLKQWPAGKHFGRAVGEIVAVNFLVWAYDYYIRPDGNDGFRVGFNSWWDNLSNGFEWDDNNFSTNQFAHPYHGSLYFNAARSNGYSYWESIPFTFAGSYLWEFFGETHHASINDWLATSVGGTFLGETLYRFSSSVLDNTATGSERTWRELGGLALNPVRGINRLVTGQAFQVYANPPDRHPNGSGFEFTLGLRSVAEEHLFNQDTTKVYLDFEFEYGNKFGDNKKPFDQFDLGVQLNFDDKSTIGRLQGQGQLMATDIKQDERSRQRIAGYQHYDYINNFAYEFGGQSIGVAHLSRFQSKSSYRMDTALHANVMLLGATKSDYENFSGRAYDYGPGYSFKLECSFGKEDWKLMRFRHEQYWLVSVNGTASEHWIAFTAVELNFPIAGFYGLGMDYILYHRESDYADYPNVSQRTPTLRVFMSWNN